MSKVRDCQRKVGYSERAAKALAERIGAEKSEEIRAYQCTVCDQWHIGHPRRWKQRTRA